MAKITSNQLKAAVTWLKNYTDRKATSSGGSSTTTSEVTKEYVDNKITFDGYETIYTIPADNITNAGIKDDTVYSLQSTGMMSINETDKYIISYAGVTYTNVNYVSISDSGIQFDDGALYAYDTDNNIKILIMNGWNLNTSNENSCRTTIHDINTNNITDLVVKKKLPSNGASIQTLTKAEYDALTIKDSSTIYLVTD